MPMTVPSSRRKPRTRVSPREVVLTKIHQVAPTAQYQRSLGYNVNLFWGILLLVFGLVMFYFGRRGTSAMRPASTTPEGRAIEEMEHRTGKESED